MDIAIGTPNSRKTVKLPNNTSDIDIVSPHFLCF
jgi:hypothetical protein